MLEGLLWGVCVLSDHSEAAQVLVYWPQERYFLVGLIGVPILVGVSVAAVQTDIAKAGD